MDEFVRQHRRGLELQTFAPLDAHQFHELVFRSAHGQPGLFGVFGHQVFVLKPFHKPRVLPDLRAPPEFREGCLAAVEFHSAGFVICDMKVISGKNLVREYYPLRVEIANQFIRTLAQINRVSGSNQARISQPLDTRFRPQHFAFPGDVKVAVTQLSLNPKLEVRLSLNPWRAQVRDRVFLVLKERTSRMSWASLAEKFQKFRCEVGSRALCLLDGTVLALGEWGAPLDCVYRCCYRNGVFRLEHRAEVEASSSVDFVTAFSAEH